MVFSYVVVFDCGFVRYFYFVLFVFMGWYFMDVLIVGWCVGCFMFVLLFLLLCICCLFKLLLLLVVLVVVVIVWCVFVLVLVDKVVFVVVVILVCVVMVVCEDLVVWLKVFGMVILLYIVSLCSCVEGELLWLVFCEGQYVNVGDLIVEIDLCFYQVQLVCVLGIQQQNLVELDNVQIQFRCFVELQSKYFVLVQELSDQQS